ncbi:MAG: 2-phospho-L-lactate guanylyltransferase [Dehalococcoidia bacterium]|nr:2-phospho-L-lactate guanylyltransferase [Dehalococcoidia bacterium]
MSVCRAIIPVKELARAKSRLREALGPEERISLSLEMLERVLDAVQIDGLAPLVISQDPQALALAEKSGAETLLDRWDGLNPSLEGAARWCRERGARSLLVLHADLPLVRREDIASIMDLGRAASVVVAPCRRHDGTNALFMRPPGIIPFAFGPGSFQTYLGLAHRQGVTVQVYRSPTIALDIDTEDDLRIWRSQVHFSEGVAR